MKLSDIEESMLSGEQGEPKRWAMEHQIMVGKMFDAKEFVEVSQAHMMADPESLGEAGVKFLEALALNGAKVEISMLTDPRGIDLAYYDPLGQTESMADLERRTIAACKKMGILMTDTCINYQTIMPPVLGAHVAYGDTGVVIYSNSVCGARSNFEGGPSALAAGLTGRTPRYGLHLDENRKATRRFKVTQRPGNLTDWGLLGAVIGKKCGSYWEVPIIEGLEDPPTSDQLKHFGAAMASWGSTPLFHITGVTPECPNLNSVGAESLRSEKIERSDLDNLKSSFGKSGDPIDVVVFAAPQLSLVEMKDLAELCRGLTFSVPVIVCTSPQVYPDAMRMGFIDLIQAAGGKVLQGTCFYQQYAREIGEANGWKRLLSNSAKIVNILGGYGYTPALASMEICVKSAVKGEII